MNYQLIFGSKVESDLAGGYGYYEQQIEGLGSEFLLSVEATLNLIERSPLHFQRVYKNKRKANIKRFPYGVFYTVSKDYVVILAVIHLTRDPQIWRSRRK